MGRCRDCGVGIEWQRTTGGKMAPVNPAWIRIRKNPNGGAVRGFNERGASVRGDPDHQGETNVREFHGCKRTVPPDPPKAKPEPWPAPAVMLVPPIELGLLWTLPDYVLDAGWGDDDDLDAATDAAREAFTAAGWDDEGSLVATWLPPFTFERHPESACAGALVWFVRHGKALRWAWSEDVDIRTFPGVRGGGRATRPEGWLDRKWVLSEMDLGGKG